MKFSWQEKALFWGKREWNHGYGPRGTSMYDLYHCYVGWEWRTDEWVWGYLALPYDAVGYELLGMGWFRLNWSLPSSWNRAYQEREFLPWLPGWARKFFIYQWPSQDQLQDKYSEDSRKAGEEARRKKKTKPRVRKTSCQEGVHPRVLSGGGMMGDGLTCVDCGRDKYPEAFGVAIKTLPWPTGTMIDRSQQGREAAWKRALQMERHG